MSDRYTRVMLTIITICPTALLIQNSIRTSAARAPLDVQRVVICDETGIHCDQHVQKVQITTERGFPDDTLKVVICDYAGVNCGDHVQKVEICEPGIRAASIPEKCVTLEPIKRESPQASEMNPGFPRLVPETYGLTVVPLEKR